MQSLESRRLLAWDATNCPNFQSSLLGPGQDEPSGPCGDAVAPLTSSSSYADASGTPSPNSENPVNYFNGTPVQAETDLRSTGFGESFGQYRTWSGVNQTGKVGNGWVNSTDPYLMVYSTFDPSSGQDDRPMIAYVQSGQSGSIFEVDSTGSGPWTSRFYNQQSIAFDAFSDTWTLTDAVGNQLTFADLPRNSNGDLSSDADDGSPNEGMFGKLLSRTDVGGQTTDYVYDSGGLLQTVTRVDAADGSAEQLQRSYVNVSNSLGGSVNLVGSVTLARRVSLTAPWTSVRSVTYDYYNGEGLDSDHGRLGDLKLVTVRDGNTTAEIIDQKYYRYYKMWGYSRGGDTGATGDVTTMGGSDTTYPAETTAWNDPFYYVFQPADNTVTSGLKMVVENESFSRMAAAEPNFLTASDADLKPFVNNFYTYQRWADGRWNYETYANADFARGYHLYTKYRVASEISQGSGGSTCSGGSGEYRFEFHVNPSASGNGNAEYDPNVWRLRTTEIFPDDTPSDDADNDRVVVYTNEVGQVILRNLVETSNLSLTPSSVSRSGRTVTVVASGHGLSSGDWVSVTGSVASSTNLPGGIPQGGKLPQFDGVVEINVIDANTFTYSLSHVPDNTATPDASLMRINAIDGQWRDYYRYRQQTASGSDHTGFGQLVVHAHPSAVTGYDEAYKGLVTNSLSKSANNPYLADDVGKIELFTYYSSTTATDTNAGGVKDYLYFSKLKHGERDGGSLLTGGTKLSRNQYFAHTAAGSTFYPLANHIDYRGDNSTGEEKTSYTYTYFAGTTRPESVTTRLPTVTSSQNGPGTSDYVTSVYDKFGREIWRKDADGFIHSVAYDTDTGAITQTIRDVDTTLTGTFTDLPAGWSTPTGGGLHLTTHFQHDSLGRHTMVTDPNGNVTHTVYDDSNHEQRVYRGWDSVNGTTTGPIEISRQYRPDMGVLPDEQIVFDEFLTTSVSPAVTGAAGSLVPTGTETITTASVESLSRMLTNTGGQVVQRDDYFSLDGVNYIASLAVLGNASDDSELDHRHSTGLDYDDRGRTHRVVDATDTITRYQYDVRGLTTKVWVGTDDYPSSGQWSETNIQGTNMTLTSTYQYDHASDGGNGSLTKSTEMIGGGSPDRVADYHYDWRDRLVATKSNGSATENTADNIRPIEFYQYDNQNRVVTMSTYDGDAATLVDIDGDGTVDPPLSSLLRSQTEYTYDNRGRLYESSRHGVDSTTGAVAATALVTQTWRDRRGNVIKVDAPGSSVRKNTFDGAGRLAVSYTSDGGGDTTWSTADDVSGDTVLQQTEYTYDDSDNLILRQHRLRFDTATGTGALRKNTSTVTPSRSYFTAMYYDDANRMTDSVNVGTNGGSVYTRSSSVPTRDDVTLVQSWQYDDAGRVSTIVQADGRTDKTFYDLLGRVTRSIDAYVDGVPSDNDDATVDFTYNGVDSTRSITVQLPGGEIQETAYEFGASLSRGDAIANNRVQTATLHPDKSTGIASPLEKTSQTVNTAGQVITHTDENGTTHTYQYDALGRVTADIVSTLGAGIDGAIRRVGTSYNTQGQVDRVTSYSDALGTTVASELQQQYNGLMQMTAEYQSADGPVDTTSTPSVDYIFSEMSGGANHSRLESVVYPSGRVLDYEYAAGVDDVISRLSSLSDSSGQLESYKYLGLDTVVERSQPQPDSRLSYIKLAGESDGDAGDRYTGLDRFGRVVDQRWIDDATGSDTDRFRYGYDQAGNRTYRENTLSPTNSELYAYDDLNRLTDFRRGTLSGIGTQPVITSATRTQSWELDALGNSDVVTTDGVTDNRTHNQQNELTGMEGQALDFDDSGNQTTDQNGKTLVWDAWNRVVEQRDGSTIEQTYRYDGLGRRIKEGNTTLFYNSGWQLFEEQESGDLVAQYTWSPVYIDALLTRDQDTTGNGVSNERIYARQDANFNITSISDDTGQVLQRFQYDAYGDRTALTSNFATTTDAYDFAHGYAGGKLDEITGRIHFRNRNYDPEQMRWNARDPIGFNGSPWNLYQYVGGMPTVLIDPMGLQFTMIGGEGPATSNDGMLGGTGLSPISIGESTEQNVGGTVFHGSEGVPPLLQNPELQMPFTLEIFDIDGKAISLQELISKPVPVPLKPFTIGKAGVKWCPNDKTVITFKPDMPNIEFKFDDILKPGDTYEKLRDALESQLDEYLQGQGFKAKVIITF